MLGKEDKLPLMIPTLRLVVFQTAIDNLAEKPLVLDKLMGGVVIWSL